MSNKGTVIVIGAGLSGKFREKYIFIPPCCKIFLKSHVTAEPTLSFRWILCFRQSFDLNLDVNLKLRLSSSLGGIWSPVSLKG